MAILVIPMLEIQTKGNANRTTSLDGVNYILQIRQNPREDFAYVSILDTENNPIRSGLKVVSNWPLMRLMRNTPRPAGQIITIDTRTIPDDPDFSEFGIDVLLGYAEEDSVS